MGKEGKRQKMIQIPSDSFANSQMSFFVIVQTLLFSPDEYYFDIFQTAGIISPFPRFSKVVFLWLLQTSGLLSCWFVPVTDKGTRKRQSKKIDLLAQNVPKIMLVEINI